MYTLAIYGKYGDLLERRKGDNLDALQRLGETILDQGLHGRIPVLKVVIFEGDWWDNRIIWRKPIITFRSLPDLISWSLSMEKFVPKE